MSSYALSRCRLPKQASSGVGAKTHKLPQTKETDPVSQNLKQAACAFQQEESPWLAMKLTVTMDGWDHLEIKQLAFEAKAESGSAH